MSGPVATILAAVDALSTEAEPKAEAEGPRRDGPGRHVERRQVYLGEGLSVRVSAGLAKAEGEVVDITPEGIGIALTTTDGLEFELGDYVEIQHTGRNTTGLRKRAIVKHVTEGTFGGRPLVRLGLSFRVDGMEGTGTRERRKAERHPVPEIMPAIATAESPLFFREWMHFQVREMSAHGMSLTTSIRNKGLLEGMELDFALTLPIIGTAAGRGRVTTVRRVGREASFRVGVAWIAPSGDLLKAVSEYLLLGNKDLSPAALRRDGFKVGSVERAVTYDYASKPSDYREVLALRLRAHQAEGRLTGQTLEDMVSSFDAHSRHITCRFGERVVGYVRVIYVDSDPAKSQYVSYGKHEVPAWLWKEGFVEAGAGATDPDFQRAGLFLPLMQHAVRVALQSGYRYMLGACADDLLDMYKQMGFEVVESRVVSPKPGWEFNSHLFVMDMKALAERPPPGKVVEAMAQAAQFAGFDFERGDAPAL